MPASYSDGPVPSRREEKTRRWWQDTAPLSFSEIETEREGVLFMIERAIPKDILKYRAKLFGGLNARQLLCLGAAAAVGYVVYGITGFIGVWQARVAVTVIPAIIPLAFGWVEIQKQPLEKIGMDMLKDNLLTPVTRRKEIRYPEMERFAQEKVAREPDGSVRRLSTDKHGKVVVKRSPEIKTIR